MNTRTVLIADDEAHITHVVSLKLRQAGFNVIVAANGQEAFELARTSRPDIIVTDFQMPVMSGYELSIALRNTQSTATIPVLMITARGHMLSPEDLKKTNIRAMMCKPFSPRHVLERILSILGGGMATALTGPGTVAA
jgi:two-component system, OmpR family, alkaline phosphatase synthesis response regulator PhoP